MKHRKRVREATCHDVSGEIMTVIKEAHGSLNSSIGWEIDFPAFRLGYISGMKNPTFETVISALNAMKTFSKLDENEREIIMLVMDGMKSRYKTAR